MPIVSGASAYYHKDENNYILVLHESLYYVSHMKHSLINTNYICSNGLEFYDNTDRDEEFYAELDDYLKITLQFKETKCTFIPHVLTQQELETCHHFDMTSDQECYPQYIDLNNIFKISQVRKLKRSVLRLQQDTMYL